MITTDTDLGTRVDHALRLLEQDTQALTQRDALYIRIMESVIVAAKSPPPATKRALLGYRYTGRFQYWPNPTKEEKLIQDFAARTAVRIGLIFHSAASQRDGTPPQRLWIIGYRDAPHIYTPLWQEHFDDLMATLGYTEREAVYDPE